LKIICEPRQTSSQRLFYSNKRNQSDEKMAAKEQVLGTGKYWYIYMIEI